MSDVLVLSHPWITGFGLVLGFIHALCFAGLTILGRPRGALVMFVMSTACMGMAVLSVLA